MLKLITKLCIGLALGILPAIWIIQNNRHVKTLAAQPIIEQLEKNWNATVTIKKIIPNLFTGVIELNHLKIKSKDPVGCTWLCKNVKLHIQKKSSISDKRINLHIELNENNISTAYKNGTLGATELFKKIFLFQSEQFNAESFFIKNIHLSATENPENPTANLQGSAYVKKDKSGLWHGRILCGELTASANNQPLITKFSGTTRFDQTAKQKPLQAKCIQSTCRLHHTLHIPFLKDDFTVAGNHNSISIKNDAETFSCTITPTKNGLCVVGSNANFAGVGKWDFEKGEGDLTLQNKNLPGDLQVKINIDKEKKISGSHTLTLYHKNKKIPFTGTFFVQAPNIIASGICPYGNYFVAANLKKKLPITKIIVQKNGTITGRLVQEREGHLSGLIEYHFLQSLLPIKLRKWLLGNRGTIEIDIIPNKLDKISGNISLKNGKLHIPGNYNLIKNFDAHFECFPKNKKLLIDNITLGMHKGEVICNNLTLHWNDDATIDFLHAYVHAKNLLLNWKDDIFSFINGTFLASKKTNQPTEISGDVIIKKSLFKESIFSGKASSSIIQSTVLPLIQNDATVHFDINVSNEQEIAIKTPFLQTQATADLKIKMHAFANAISTPQICGNITLRRGTITFPKNKLFISSGKIDFIPTQINNPMINLRAKNRIKKYLISLNVAGPLQQPTIFLESNPALEEEQIIALLFAGSETVNLKANLPIIIMQNLHKLIFGDRQALPPAQRFFKKLTTPLKYVQITPNFTDQSGRGGVRGTIAVDINKQLHAQIQKNFTMQDDLAFQLEYFLSDNFNVKAIKDARGDIGTELELVYQP